MNNVYFELYCNITDYTQAGFNTQKHVLSYALKCTSYKTYNSSKNLARVTHYSQKFPIIPGILSNSQAPLKFFRHNLQDPTQDFWKFYMSINIQDVNLYTYNYTVCTYNKNMNKSPVCFMYGRLNLRNATHCANIVEEIMLLYRHQIWLETALGTGCLVLVDRLVPSQRFSFKFIVCHSL